MDDKAVSPQTTIADVLRRPGSAHKVFIGNRTACVGCSLARFCSVSDVATSYDLNLVELIQELEEAIHVLEPSSKRSDQ